MTRGLACVIVVLALLVPASAAKGPSVPPADRPVYDVGQVWVRNDGRYRLERIENDRYVFSAGPGREVRLTRDLGLARLERDGTYFTFDPPIEFTWPLAVGRWGLQSTQRAASGTPRGARVNVSWRVEGTDDVTLPGGSVAAFRIAVVQDFVATGRQTVQRFWYAPAARQFVRSAGDDWLTFQFDVVALPGDDERLAGGALQPMAVEVSTTTGTVEFQHGDPGTWRAAAVGQRLAESDSVRTSGGGIVELALPNGAGLIAYDGTVFVLTKLEYEPRTGVRNVSVHVQTGAVRVVRGGMSPDPTRPSTFMVSTPSGVAAMRGGVSAVVAHEEPTRESVVAAVEGADRADPAGFLTYVDYVSSGVQTIRPGQFVRQSVSKAPSRATPLGALGPGLRGRLPLPER